MLVKLYSEIMIFDMESKADTAQFGNEKQSSIQHYLRKMIHKIHTSLDNNSRRATLAVTTNMIDWNSSFVRQCPRLGIESFQKNAVRVILSREISICQVERFHNVSKKNKLGSSPGSKTMNFRISQSDNSAYCVIPDERFNFVDDLTILEIVNLLTIVHLSIKKNVYNSK